jgi:hypothetical protein
VDGQGLTPHQHFLSGADGAIALAENELHQLPLDLFGTVQAATTQVCLRSLVRRSRSCVPSVLVRRQGFTYYREDRFDLSGVAAMKRPDGSAEKSLGARRASDRRKNTP